MKTKQQFLSMNRREMIKVSVATAALGFALANRTVVEIKVT